MTGLDIKKDHIIEIAVLITDGELDIIAEVYYHFIFTANN
jgi:oligoribonuclease